MTDVAAAEAGPPAIVPVMPIEPIKLTPQQENFARHVVIGFSASEAYRRSYVVRPKTKPASIWVNASKLSTNVKVSQRIEQLKAEAAARAGVTRESMLAEMAMNRALAIDAGEIAAANTASRDRARVGGLLKDADESGSGNVTINVQINGADAELL